jgi:hypothetical protein
MKSRWILNLALVALIGALAAVAYFKPSEKQTGAPLMDVSADAVQRIRIEKNGAAPIVLEKNGDRWQLSQPVRARANEFNITSLLRLTKATSSFQASADAATLATYGLDKPALRLWLNGEEFLVGSIHPMRQQHYLRYRDTIHLVDSHVLSTAWFNYASLIDTQLLDTAHKLTAVRTPNVRLSLKDGVWRREPHDPKISVDSLNDFVAHWQNAQALAVEKLSNAAPIGFVELVVDIGGKATSLKMDILAYKPEFVLARRNEGLEYHFPETTGKRLLSLDVKGE